MQSSPFRWSFSQWEAYTQCPAKWHYASVLKLPRAPAGPAAARGTAMHDRCEAYIVGKLDKENLLAGDATLRFGARGEAKVQPQFLSVLDEFRSPDNKYVGVEERITVTPTWQEATVHDAPWAVGVFDAVRMDANDVLHIAEWKSGKPKPTHEDQRKLYAALGLCTRPTEEVVVTTYYLENTAPPQRLVARASAADKLKTLWNVRALQMQTDSICAPRPNQWCNYCDFAKSKGGPCQFG